MQSDSPTRPRTGVRRGTARTAVLLAFSIALGGIALPALADVGRDDIREAEAAVTEAAARLRDAEDALDAGRRRLERIEESLASVERRLADTSTELEEGRREARDRIARMYMVAGDSEAPAWLMVGDISQLPAHAGYLGAVARQDREVVGRLAWSQEDLVRLREVVSGSLAGQEAEVEDLAGTVDQRRAELEAARGDAGRVQAAWEQQEAERRRAEEAERQRLAEEERRRQEEAEQQRLEEERRQQQALAAMQAAAAAASAAGWTPGAGVEPWRPLVAKHFPPDLVEDALRVMSCESHGDPLAVNRYSAASGLFQHLPYYWPSRAQKAGWAGADILDPEANIAVSAWLVRQTVQVEGREPWGHWTCKP